MQADRPESVPAHWYDGVSAVRHSGTAHRDGAGGLVLVTAQGAQWPVAAGALVEIERRSDRVTYALAGNRDFRLVFARADVDALGGLLPQGGEYGGWIDRIGLGKAALGFAMLSAALVAAVITAPDWLGPRIPPPWERAIGRAMVGDVDRRICHTPEADAALARLLAQVDPARRPVAAGIANIAMVNAVALPGETVLLFDGIVQQAKTPEELAGVLAHEVGHVRERHVMTAMMRQFGLSVLLAGADSGVLSNASNLAAMGYSREAESEADAFARARLAQADISPLGAAEFFERMIADQGEAADEPAGIAGWVASHPAAGARARAFRQAARPGHSYAPALSAKEFVALKQACARDQEVEDGDLF